MPVFISDNNSSLPFYYEGFKRRAKEKKDRILDRQERIELGKEAATFVEKLLRFFQDCAIFFSQGLTRAIQEHENYFDGKSIHIIRTINTRQLEKIVNEGEDSINGYLSRLETGQVLVSHFDLQAISFFCESYHVIQEAKRDQNHWLNHFRTAGDLGEDFENFYALSPEIQKRVRELDTIQKKALHPHFSAFVKMVLFGQKLKDLSDSQFKEIKTCIDLSRAFARKGIEGTPDVQKGHVLFKRIEETKGKPEAAAFKSFFLAGSPAVQNLFLRFSQEEAASLLDVKRLIEKLNAKKISLPVDLYFSRSLNDMVEKLTAELPENATTTRINRFGEHFAAFYSKLDPNKIPESVKELYRIEADFRLCGESKRFKEIIQEHFEGVFKKGFNNLDNFNKCLASMKDYHVSNESIVSSLYSMGQLAQQIRNYIEREVIFDENFEQFLSIKSLLLKAGSGTILIKESDNQATLNGILNNAVSDFNKQQYQQTQESWQNYFGDRDFDAESQKMAKQSYFSTINGIEHYKSNSAFIHRQVELEKMFLLFNLKDLAKEYGPNFLSYAVHYLFYESEQRAIAGNQAATQAEKERIQDPYRLRQDWNGFLQSLSKLRDELAKEEGIDATHFNESWEKFVPSFDLKESNRLIDRTNGLALSPTGIKEFKESIEFIKTKNELEKFKTTHGELFSECLEEYLKHQEPDVLKGKKTLSSAKFFVEIPEGMKDATAIFKHQLEKLKPHFAARFQPLSAVSLQTAASLYEASSPDDLKNRFSYLIELNDLCAFKTKPEEQELKLLEEYLPFLNRYFISSGYVIHDDSSELIQKITQDFLALCKQDKNRQKAYSPAILAASFFELAKNSSPEQLPDFIKGLKKQSISFNELCFKKYVLKIQETATQEQGANAVKVKPLIDDVLRKFIDKHQIPLSPSGVEYLNHLIRFIVELSLLTNDEQLIRESLSKEKIEYNLNMINKTANPHVLFKAAKPNVLATIKAKRQENEYVENLLTLIEKDPFALLEKFLPSFIAQFSIEGGNKANRKEILNDFSPLFSPLAPHVNRSWLVAFIKGVLPPLLRGVMELLNNDKKDGSTTDLVTKKIDTLVNLKLEETSVSKCEQIRIQLEDEGFDIIWTIIQKLLNLVKDAHRTKPAAGTKPEKESKFAFFHEGLPKLLSNQATIETAITTLTDKFLPALAQGGTFAEGTTMLAKTTISFGLLQLFFGKDNALANVISEHLTAPMIKAVLLAIPAFKTKHKISSYVGYITKINAIIQSQNAPTEAELDQLAIETLEIFQQLINELKAYTPILKEIFNLAFPNPEKSTN